MTDQPTVLALTFSDKWENGWSKQCGHIFPHKDKQQHPSNGGGDAEGDFYVHVWVNRPASSVFWTTRKHTVAVRKNELR